MIPTTFNGDLIIRATPVNVMLPTRYVMPKEVMQAALDVYMEEHVKQNRSYGELNYAERHMYDTYGTINLRNISHRMTGYHWWMDTTNLTTQLYIHARPCDTPLGNSLKDLLAADVSIHASYRGIGSIVDNKASADFRIVCFDISTDSVPASIGIFRQDEFGQRV